MKDMTKKVYIGVIFTVGTGNVDMEYLEAMAEVERINEELSIATSTPVDTPLDTYTIRKYEDLPIEYYVIESPHLSDYIRDSDSPIVGHIPIAGPSKRGNINFKDCSCRGPPKFILDSIK